MTHEVAHQFAVSHSWNNCPGNDDQRAGRTAFEPGSGNTIMSYQGACPGNNIPGPGDYYHVGSLQQFRDFYTAGPGSTCGEVVAVDNERPVVSAPGIDGLTIPAGTPFVLEGSATDADGDGLLYTWEQYDVGAAVELGQQRESTPLFRSEPPSPGGNVRYLPNREDVLRDRTNVAELLPAFGRELTFRLTARDRSPLGGGTDWAEVRMRVDGDAGPFAVTSQARGSVYAAGALRARDLGRGRDQRRRHRRGGRGHPPVYRRGTHLRHGAARGHRQRRQRGRDPPRRTRDRDGPHYGAARGQRLLRRLGEQLPGRHPDGARVHVRALGDDHLPVPARRGRPGARPGLPARPSTSSRVRYSTSRAPSTSVSTANSPTGSRPR